MWYKVSLQSNINHIADVQPGAPETLTDSNTIPPTLLCGAGGKGEPRLHHSGLNHIFEIN